MVDFFISLSLAEQVIYPVLLITFLYQCFVWLGFATIATHSHRSKTNKKEGLPSISIIAVVEDGGAWWVESELEKLLKQDYRGEWEIVVVNDCGGLEVANALSDMELKHPKTLRSTELKKDLMFKHSRKIPLLVGIKSARFENIVVADPTASPDSNKWLAGLSDGFIDGSVVIGYTGFIEKTSNYIRSSRLMSSIRYINAAIRGRAYRGIYNNIGYTKTAFFANNGFSHLRLATGEDDLFVQSVAPGDSARVIIGPESKMEQHPYGGIKWWWNEQRYRTYSYKFYPRKVKFRVFMELLVKLLFLGAVITTIVCSFGMDGYKWGWAIGVGVLVLREIVVCWAASRIMKRLGEKKMLFSFVLYDMINPLTELILCLSRHIRVNPELWR